MSDKRRDSDGNLYPSTTSSTRVKSGDKVLWNNFQGTKDSHDLAATQMNIKDTKTQEHTYYSPASGPMGVAGGNRDRKKNKDRLHSPKQMPGAMFCVSLNLENWQTPKRVSSSLHQFCSCCTSCHHYPYQINLSSKAP